MRESQDEVLRLLVVDDNEAVLESYRQVVGATATSRNVSLRGAELQGSVSQGPSLVAADGRVDLVLCRQADEAVGVVRDSIEQGRPFATAFIDVRMPPGPDGIWAAEQIRALDPHVNLVMVTAYSDYDPEDIARRVPPPDQLLYMQKPFHAVEMQRFVWALGAKWRADRLHRSIQAKLEAANEQLTRDIRGRKRTEEALRESETRYRELFEHLNDAAFVADVETGVILETNLQGEALLGRSRDEILGMQQTRLHSPGKADEYKRKFAKHIEKGRAADYDGEVVKGDGTIVPVSISAHTLTLQGRHLMVGLFHDLTERKRAEEERRLLEQQLFQAQKLESLGTLAGGVAHDFNNLLTGIIGMIELALRQIDPTSKAYEYLAKLPEQGQRAAELISSLLTFSRQTISERQPLALLPLVKETVKVLKRTLPESIEVRMVWREEEEPIVLADATQMQQVIMNLATNARDAMPDGGQLTVELAAVRLEKQHCRHIADATPGDYVCLSVRDTGIGMTPEVQDRIFEPFFTTKDPGQGTGLGLAMVYGIVKNHNGFIEVRTQLGEDTELKIYFPAAHSQVLAKEECAHESLPRGTEAVLLVEDDSTVLTVGQQMLETVGYTVLTASNGEQALEMYLARQEEISLVLTDITMPKMGGYDLYNELSRINQGVKVLLVSGYALEEEVSDLRTRGMKGLVRKPFDLKTLATTVKQALDE